MLKSVVLVLLVTVACGPSARMTPGGDDDDNNSGDGGGGSNALDCANNCGSPACSGLDGCPVCGMVDQPLSTPLALPDTNQATGRSCTTDAQCSSSYPNCIQGGDGGECALSYTDTLNFIGFGSGATLTNPNLVLSVCATIEHSYFGDLQIELISPDGKIATIRKFRGLGAIGEFFLGHANDCDTDSMPVPGVGYKYCWTPTATETMLTTDGSTCGAPSGCESWTNPSCPSDTGSPSQVIPAGNYETDSGFSPLMGAQLNGNWTFRITDLWEQDNGYLFDWSIQFDPSLISNCSNPIIQ